MSFLQNLPELVSLNDLDAQLYFQVLRTQLQSSFDQILAQQTFTCFVTQSSQPNQSQWEAQWLADGHTLPIPPSALLFWISPVDGTISGVFGTTNTSSTVISREIPAPRTGSFWGVATQSSAQSTSATINANNTVHPSTTFTTTAVYDLILEYRLHTVLSSGTGTWGADFLLNGAKVGTAYYGLPANVGLINISATGPLYVKTLIQNVPAGTHTIQAIMGVTGAPASPPTIAYGGIAAGAGQYGLRTLLVRGVKK